MFQRPETDASRGSTLARWVTLGALFAIPFLPLVVDKTLYFPFVVGRNFAFRMLVEVALAGGVVLAVADRRYRPEFSWTLSFFGLFVAWMGLADAFAVNPHKAFWGNLERMEGWVTLIHLFAFVVVAGSVLGAEGLWKRWWLTFVGASGLVCAYGLAQLAHLARINGAPTRIDANFGNAEFLAGYLLFAIAATLWLAVEIPKEGRWRRYGLFGLAALQTFILMASGTRGAAVGLVAAVGFSAVLWLLQAGRSGRRAAALMLMIPVVLIGALLWLRQDPAGSQNPILARFAHIGLGDLQVRFSLWRMAWEGFLSRPVLGWGQEGFPYVFSRFYDPALTGQQPWFDRAHSLYLDWLVAGGAPSLILLLATIASAAYGLCRGPFSRPGRILLLAGLVAYGVQGLVVFDNLMTYAPLCAVLALAHSVWSTPVAAFERLPQMGPRLLVTAAAPLAILTLVAVIWLAIVPTLRSARDLMTVINPPGGGPMRLGYFKRAIDRHGFASREISEKMGQVALLVVASPEAPADAKMGFAAYASDQMARELVRAPHDVRLRLQLAKLRRAVGDARGAASQLAAALDDAPLNPLLLEERDTPSREAASPSL